MNAPDKTKLDAATVRRLLSYDGATGKFYWKPRTKDLVSGGGAGAEANMKSFNAKHAGKEALIARDTNGYRYGRILGRNYSAHRMAWLWVTGDWPNSEIDHKDGDKSNNRWENLREATRSQNLSNKKIRSDNASGFKGVWWHKTERKFMARASFAGQRNFLGRFDTAEEAYEAYCKAAAEMHGEFARLS